MTTGHKGAGAQGLKGRAWKAFAAGLGVLLLLCGALIGLPRPAAHPALAATGDWPTYLGDAGRSGFNGNETAINPASAPYLQLQWSLHAGGPISTQPVEANGLIYWGSWDGFEHATALDGSPVWATNLGQTVDNNPACSPNVVGVASTAAVAAVSLNGTTTQVVFVGGGNAQFYALDAASGAILWQTALGSSPSHFVWSSPAVYNGSVYVGVASLGDCPRVQGQLVQMDSATGAIQHTFDVVPAGCLGGAVWGSPTVDQGGGAIYIATGDNNACPTAEQYAPALVKLRASDLTVLDSWQVPQSQRGTDSDFGATPTLFQATVGGSVQQLVGVANKNGTYYAFNRSSIGSGPVWTAAIATGGDCPDCGNGSIPPGAWDGTQLYVAGGNTTINGSSCQGSVRAFNPANGTVVWEHCLAEGPVLGAVSAVPGIVAVGEGTTLVLMAAASGQGLFSYTDTKRGSSFYGPPSISNGVLYVGNADGTLYAFSGPAATPTPTPSPPPAPSPSPAPSGAPVSPLWYFAEGKVGGGFQEWLTVENPDPAHDCSVDIQYLLGAGSPVERSALIPHASRYTENVNADLATAPAGSQRFVSAIITVTNPAACGGVVAERPLYFTNFMGVSSGSDVVGATRLGTSFYFADVPTGGNYASYITVLNPASNPHPARVTATFEANGAVIASQTQTITVQPGQRGTVIPNNSGPLLHAAVAVTSDEPIVAERPLYFRNAAAGNAGTVSGASSLVGVQTPQTEWLFAEGYTGTGFQEDLALANFGAAVVSGTALLEFANGHTESLPFTIQPSSQTTIDVNQALARQLGTCDTAPCQPTQALSADITATGPFVAQREMYFHYTHVANGRTLSATGGTDVIGAGATGVTTYSFAEGYTNVGYDEWLTLQNATAGDETIAVTLANGDGRNFTQPFPVAAHSRSTVDITDMVLHHLIAPGDTYRGYEVSIVVQSGSGPFTAERPMYWNTGPAGTQGGSDVVGYAGQ